MISFKACLAATLMLLLGLPTCVLASSVDAVSNAGDPVAVTSCSFSEHAAHLVVSNRTRHDLLSVIFHFVDYDGDAKQIGGLEVGHAPTPVLLGGQSARYDVPMDEIPLFAGSPNQIVRQVCEIESAILSGNHIWASGLPWAEPLVDAAPPSESVELSSATMPAQPARAQTQPVDKQSSEDPNMTVLTSWTTPGQNIAYLHVRVNMHPVNSVMTHASDFRLVTTSQTGGPETEYGLNQPAPIYQRVNAVGGFLAALNKQTAPTPTPVVAVSPSEDLGAQRQLQVFGGDPVTYVVTFMVRPDTDADPVKIARSLQWLAPAPTDSSAPDAPSFASNQSSSAPQGRLQFPTQRIGLPDGTSLTLDLFNSAGTRSVGLSGRSGLQSHTGGLFVMSPADGSITMVKRTPFPMDVIFIRADGAISSIQTVGGVPAGTPDGQLPRIYGFGTWVIVIPAGEATLDGINMGRHITGLPAYAR